MDSVKSFLGVLTGVRFAFYSNDLILYVFYVLTMGVGRDETRREGSCEESKEKRGAKGLSFSSLPSLCASFLPLPSLHTPEEGHSSRTCFVE